MSRPLQKIVARQFDIGLCQVALPGSWGITIVRSSRSTTIRLGGDNGFPPVTNSGIGCVIGARSRFNARTQPLYGNGQPRIPRREPIGLQAIFFYPRGCSGPERRGFLSPRNCARDATVATKTASGTRGHIPGTRSASVDRPILVLS